MKFFNSSKKWRFASSSITKYILAALLSLAGVQGVLAQYYVAGDGWTCGENLNPSGCAMSQSRDVYVYDSPVLAAGTYLFRITDGTSNTTWGWSEVYSSRCTAIVADAGGDDHNVKITLNESSTVKIIFNPNAAAGHKITVYAGITPLYIRGDVNSWGDPSDWQGVSTDGINYTWEGTSLPTGNEGKTNLGGAFKIATAVYANVNGNDTWYWDDNFDFGGEESGTSIQISDTGTTTATLKAKTETGGNGNLSLSGNLQYSGAVYATRITFNISTKELVIYTAKIEPTKDSYVVEWAEPVYDSAAGTVTVSATVSTAENAGFTLADATFEAQVNVKRMASSARTKLNQNNNSISHTIQGVQAGSTVNYSLQIVTGGDSKIVLPSDVQNINPQAYTVPESVEPEPVSLYLIGAGTGAQWNLADALPFTYENGVYTWTGELTANSEAFKILTSNTVWEPAYVAETDQFVVVPGKDIDLYYREKLGENQYTRDDNKFKITESGEYTIKVTLGGDNSGSMIVTKKSDPVYAATITADASASQETAKQVVLTSSLTETSASTDLSAATCQFQYLSADAAEGTEYSNLDAPVAYNAEGASLTTTALLQGGKYLFRAVWTLNVEVVATSEPSEATCVYPIWPEPEMFDVVWIPTYNTSDGSVTITAEISAKEDACFVMGQIVGLVANIFVDNASQATSMSNPSGAENNKATATATIQNVNEGQELAYRLELTTGASQQVLGRGGIQIPGGTYIVAAPEVHNSTVYLRGDVNGWAYDGIDDKYIGKTYDDVNVFWDWSDSPVEFVTTGESGGSKFKFDDTTDGAWGAGQWNNGSSDAWIGEEQISDNKATFTAIKGDPGNLGNFWILPNICPAKISRIDLNVETNQLVITFDSYKKEFKDLWFRSPIVKGGWGDGISDPLDYGVNPKYQGQTSDGVVYVWDWSGSNAVTIDAGTNFKFGEYTGDASWGNTAYGGSGAEDRNFTSADFGKQLKTIAAAGYEFSPAEKVTITGVTLDTENMTVVFKGEAYVERFPVTVNKVNGENGSVVTDPSDITNMAIGETVTVTATANEGYVALFEATSGCVMTGGSADNIKVFEITEANPVITVTFQVQCETVEPRFDISGQFNAGVTDGDWLYQGTAVESGDDDPKDGYWSDGARYIQLTANNVTANYFDWECTRYEIDGVDQGAVPEISWTDKDKTSARAELSLPGTYTFVCDAKCNSGDDWTRSAELTITAPAPEMGTSGTGYVGFGTWHHSDAGDPEKGLMTKTDKKLEWKSGPLRFDNFNSGEFVIIQRYKRGCTEIPEYGEVGDEGWMGYNVNSEGETVCTVDGNKINSSILSSYSGFTGAPNNFQPSKDKGWTNETQLQLTVTMSDYNTYSIVLDEYPKECQNIQSGFEISALLNAGEDSPWEGNVVVSGSNTETGGYFADDHRTVTLSTDVVADSYEWTYQYFVDNELSQENQITWGEGSNTASTVYATLNLPGKYVFTCNAVCGGTTYSSGTVTIETYPAMGMDGPITTWGWENHSVAGSSGIMTREIGSLVWKKDFVCATNAGEGENPYEFVVIQQYKNGCVENEGWAGHEECDLNGAKYNNKINDSTIDRTAGSVDFDPDHGTNFIPSSIPAAGSNLTLYVEMTGFDSYKVWLAVDVKLKSSVATEGEPEDPSKGGDLIVKLKSDGTAFENGADLSNYVGKDFTISTNPKDGYKLKSITINGTTYTSSGDRVVTLTNAGLEVSAVFTLDCITPMEYTVTGGGIYCSNGGCATVNLSYSQSGINYTLYNLYNGDEQPVENSTQGGTGSSLSWNVSTDGTYTVKAIDAKETCSGQTPVNMSGSASVTSVSSVEIKASPNSKISIYQPMTYTTTVPVDWSSSVDGGGDLITMSQSEKQWIVKATGATTDINYYTITARMKSPNQNCQSTVTLNVDNVVPWVCDPGEAGLPTSTNGE